MLLLSGLLVATAPSAVAADPVCVDVGGVIAIDSAAQLAAIGTDPSCPLDGHYLQAGDIDLSGYPNWDPIGTGSAKFTGIYDGGENEISGLTSNRDQDVGLFGFVLNATVKDLTVVSPNVSSSGFGVVGAAVGAFDVDAGQEGELSGVWIEGGTITSDGGGRIGGVLGAANVQGTLALSDLHSSATVTDPFSAQCGGLAGDVRVTSAGVASVVDSSAEATVTCTGLAGGLVGELNVAGAASVLTSSAGGTVQATSIESAGGLIGTVRGREASTVLVEGSAADATVTAATGSAGGLIGRVRAQNTSGISVEASTAAGAVESSGNGGTGGLIGRIETAAGASVTVEGSSSTGSATGVENVGGLIGRAEPATLTDVQAVGAVEGSGYSVGGLIGQSQQANIANARATGPVRGVGYVGALIGYDTDSVVNLSSAAGGVEGTENAVGGLIGRAVGSTVAQSFSTAEVQGSTGVGGLIGIASGLTSVANSFSRGSIVGMPAGTNFGGLVGNVQADTLTVATSYAAVPINGAEDSRGGLIGNVSEGALANVSVTSFWDSEIGPDTSTGGGEARSTSQMQQRSTFDGWDIANGWDEAAGTVWGICDGDSYPFLNALTNENPCPPVCGALDAEGRHQVGTAEQLAAVGSGGPGSGACGLGASYRLVGTIDLTGVWSPIGSDAEPFTGQFDGGGNRITDLDVSGSTNVAGLFAVTRNATIRNLTLDAPTISSSGSAVGAVVGQFDAFGSGELSGLEVLGGSVHAGGGNVGGIAGVVITQSAEGTFTTSNLYSSANVTSGSTNCGGVFGTFEVLDAVSASLTSVSSDGNVLTCTGPTGGSIGHLRVRGTTSTTIESSTATGGIRSSGNNPAGGLIGYIDADDDATVTLTSVSAEGEVTVSPSTHLNAAAGGLVGRITNPGTSTVSMNDVHAYGDVIAVTAAVAGTGGLVGNFIAVGPASIADATSSGNVSGGDNSGGLIGDAQNLDVNDVTTTGSVTGKLQVGGLFGYSDGNTIVDAQASGDVTGSSAFVGGLIGLDARSELTRTAATGDVQGGAPDTGGLIGQAAYTTITTSYATGEVIGSDNVGGLVGQMFVDHEGSISNSYSLATLNDDPGDGRGYGGLVGSVGGGTLPISASYAAVPIIGASGGRGGLIGAVDGGGGLSVAASFWDTTIGPDSSVGGGSPQTTMQMQRFVTYNDAGWDIVDGWAAVNGDVWGICAGVNGGYPFLLWEYDTDACSAPEPDPGPGPVPGPVVPEVTVPVRTADGVLPGEGQVAGEVDGLPVEVAVSAGAGGGVVVSGDGFEITVSPADGPDGEVGDGDDAEVSLQLRRGRGVQVAASGFAPRSALRVSMWSQPVELGVFTTDNRGGLDVVSGPVPQGVSGCPHVVHVQGLLPDGGRLELSLGAWVMAAGAGFVDTGGTAFERYVGCLADVEVARGYGDGTFGPNRVVTRQALAALLYRLAGEPEPEDVAGVLARYSDVGVSHPFATEIAWLSEEGLSFGYEDGTFGPSRPVTRQALAAFLYRQAGEPQVGAVGGFVDVGGEHPFAAEIGWAAQVGITDGYEDATFRPSEPVRRGPAAALLVRATARDPGLPR